MRSTPIDRSCAGFTLMELMVVMGVIAILMGVGIGFLSKSESNLAVTRAILRDKVRLAYESARRSNQPASVQMLTVGEQGEEQYFLFAKVLRPAFEAHFEPDERVVGRLDPISTGLDVAHGRYGHALRPDPDSQQEMFRLRTADSSRFNLIDGFAIRVELYLEARDSCVVVEFGEIRISLDEDLVPSAKMRLSDGVQRARGKHIDLTGGPDSALPLRKWVSLSIVHDGLEFRLVSNGETLDKKVAVGEPYQAKQRADLIVSSANAPVPGCVDEFRLLAYERDEMTEVPERVTVAGLSQPIRFDRTGKLRGSASFVLGYREEKTRLRIAPGGVIEAIEKEVSK